MTIYFHKKRFSETYDDLTTVESLDSKAYDLVGNVYPTARDLILHWLEKHPEGSVHITNERS